MCNHADALAKEFRTGDLIRVSHRCETGLQVFLFKTNSSIWYVNLEDCNENGFPTDSHDIRVAASHLVSPVQKVLRVKKASEIVKWLEDNGYFVNENGDWDSSTWRFKAKMFRWCGQEPISIYKWLPEWLEEHYV